MNDAEKSGLKEKLRNLPLESGVYLFRDSLGRIIYIGKAKNLKNRVSSYFQAPGRDTTRRILYLQKIIADFDYIVVGSPISALILETNLIKRHRPAFNVKMRDDKRYPLIEITGSEAFPRLRTVRKSYEKSSRYFGPFTSSMAMRRIFKMVQQIFQLRTCKYDMEKPLSRPCLDFHLNLCTAPCVRNISEEAYGEHVAEAKRFLDGRIGDTLALLRRRLDSYSENLEFEKCIGIREQIRALEYLSQRHEVVTRPGEDMDFAGCVQTDRNMALCLLEVRDGKLLNRQDYLFEIPPESPDEEGESLPDILERFILQRYSSGFFIPSGIYIPVELPDREILEAQLTEASGRRVRIILPRRGEKHHLLQLAVANAREYESRISAESARRWEIHREELEDLQSILGLKNPPARIEGYDISNISGDMATASMVVFFNGEPLKSHYRSFTIKDTPGPDDFAMMEEALGRRLKNLELGEMESFRETPDLILIDGGKGQLNSALKALEERSMENIPMISLAKREEEIFIPGSSESLPVAMDSPGLNLLRRVRDEAHRFALTHHRGIRGKRLEISILDEIPGIGPRKKETLLQNFDSIDDIKNAGLFELEALPGFNRRMAENVLKYLGKPESE